MEQIKIFFIFEACSVVYAALKVPLNETFQTP